jgi:DNA primase
MNRYKHKFNPDLLPSPVDYCIEQKIKITPRNEKGWINTNCPMHGHKDKRASFGINLDSGAFCCHGCGIRGSNILDLHIKIYGLLFFEAMIELGAWE